MSLGCYQTLNSLINIKKTTTKKNTAMEEASTREEDALSWCDLGAKEQRELIHHQ